jgi:hypothetical protein
MVCAAGAAGGASCAGATDALSANEARKGTTILDDITLPH